MKLKNPLLLVTDLERSVAFYKEVLGLRKIMDFGAFVELAPGKDGLCHISKLDSKRVNRVEDVVSLGDEITVKVTEIDRMGRINLSRKDAIKELMNEDTELISAQ